MSMEQRKEKKLLKKSNLHASSLHPRLRADQPDSMSAASLAALPAPLRPTDDDWAKMLAAHVHLGTKNLDNKMVRCRVKPFSALHYCFAGCRPVLAARLPRVAGQGGVLLIRSGALCWVGRYADMC